MKVVKISWRDTIPIRHKVLWPDKEPDFCKVEGDEKAIHYGMFVDENLVGVASIYIDLYQARLRKFAILEEFQNRGLGGKVLMHILDDLSKFQINYFWFDARESAISFYRKFGFQVEGNRFLKNKVAYFKMGKLL